VHYVHDTNKGCLFTWVYLNFSKQANIRIRTGNTTSGTGYQKLIITSVTNRASKIPITGLNFTALHEVGLPTLVSGRYKTFNALT